MISSNIVYFLIVYVVFEFFEAKWQSGSNVYDLLSRVYFYYKRSIFLVFLLSPTFYFSIFLSIYTDYNTYALVFFVLKGIDLVVKLQYVKQVFLDKYITKEMQRLLSFKIGNIFYLNLLIYAPFIWLSFS